MNDEIKEILNGFKEILDNPTTIDEWYNGRIIEIDRSYDLDLDEIKTLLDYITNLQQENESLKEKSINEVLKNDFDMCVKDLKKANKKIEKAVEYIEKEKSNYMRSCDISNATNREGLIISSAVRTCDDLLNILNGRSDE